ncbi:hypothetical protein ACWDV4_20855 [Micromonospora sp. NPDC003197]
MNVPELLRSAAGQVPLTATGAAGASVLDANEYLEYAEWEIAFDILVELGDGYHAEAAFWELLAEAARLMGRSRTERWCHWRRFEAVHGVLRANLQLVDPDAAGGRRTPISGGGHYRPLWDIGDVTATGDPELYVARIWVEDQPILRPGGKGVVRLAPLSPRPWRRLVAGDVIAMHERMPVAGVATVIEAGSGGSRAYSR